MEDTGRLTGDGPAGSTTGYQQLLTSLRERQEDTASLRMEGAREVSCPPIKPEPDQASRCHYPSAETARGAETHGNRHGRGCGQQGPDHGMGDLAWSRTNYEETENGGKRNLRIKRELKGYSTQLPGERLTWVGFKKINLKTTTLRILGR